MINLNVTDVKQYIYCPRIIYFTYCQPVHKKNSFKMDFGSEMHDIVDVLEKRRTLKRYNLEYGEKLFKQKVFSDKLGLSGKLDMLVKTERELIPIEMKYTQKKPGINHKYQLAAYMLLLEEVYHCGIRGGIIHIIPTKESYYYKNTKSLRTKVREIIKKIREIIIYEKFPEKCDGWRKCKNCEYKNYCGDV
ncbi:MAG: CRISPR-associated protein Cas4 [Halanaerobiales bacterium]